MVHNIAADAGEVVPIEREQVAQQINLRARLLTARFGATPDGTRWPLRPGAARYVSENLPAERIEPTGMPLMPYSVHELGFIDCNDGSGKDRSRYVLRWMGLPEPELIIDRKLWGDRQSVIAVSGRLSCATINYRYDPGHDIESAEAHQDIAGVHEILSKVSLQASFADVAGHHFLHHIENDSIRHPQFVQLPPGLLAQN